MLSVTDFLTIQAKPKEADISLQTIQEFYKEHLCNRLFVFELEDDSRPVVKLRFEENNLPHLLGIQHIMKGIKKSHLYIGQSGYDLMKNGTLTLNLLKTTNKSWYKSKKDRILYFPFVYQILNNPTAIIFDNSIANTNIDVDIILYNKLNNIYLHLGIDRSSGSEFYYPKSFYDRKKDDHITGQSPINIKSKRIEID
ncbi:PBECR4 domain-containing protein [Metabacillus fastidiosus]|uniref:PBECR4 domain-containing protein n=1 Tax=Metabacillus fastidiosus TaxID=1458 RepID=UPI002E2131F9|nr:PBECR4 domain-containing protein [Metabacillus fastidiosus]